MHAEADVLQSAYCDHSCCNKGLASAVRLSFITVILPAHCSIYSSMRVHLLLWWSLLFQGVASFTRMTTVKAHTQTHTQRRLSASAMSRHGERVNGQWCSQSCIMFCSSFSVNRELFHQCRECDNTGNAHTSLVGTQRESQQPFPLFQADTGKKIHQGSQFPLGSNPLKTCFVLHFIMSCHPSANMTHHRPLCAWWDVAATHELWCCSPSLQSWHLLALHANAEGTGTP